MEQTVTLLLNVNSRLKHEHGIDTFIIHVTTQLAATLVALVGAVAALEGHPAVAGHLGPRKVAAVVLQETAETPGMFLAPNTRTRAVRRGRQREKGVWAVPHTKGLGRPSGVAGRHLVVTPTGVWWTAQASIRLDELTTEPVSVETLSDIAAGTPRVAEAANGS